MFVRLSKREPFINKYFWGCSAYPYCRDIEDTILLKKDLHDNFGVNDLANSMLVLQPNDILTDAERHYAICNHFNYDHMFQSTDLENLDMKLGFESREDFHFWIATQQSIVNGGEHAYLPTGSPYYYTFRSLTDFINQSFDNSIQLITSEKQSLIERSIIDWTNFFNRRTV